MNDEIEPEPPQEEGLLDQPNNNDARTFAQGAHFGIAILSFVPALFIYALKNRDPWIKNEAAKAFNFSFTYSGIVIIIWITNIALGISIISSNIIETIIGIIFCSVLVVCVLLQAIYGIINGVRVESGSHKSKYPISLKILR